MFRSYLKIAFRSIRKNKLISFINVFGLGLSMSIGLMVMIRLQDQLSYDKFEPNKERIVRVISDFTKMTGEKWEMTSTPVPLNARMEQICPSVEKSVSIIPGFAVQARAHNKEIRFNGAFTSSNFFAVLGFPLEKGDTASALVKPNSIALTSETAEKYFGTTDPLGQQMTTENGELFTVTGVLAKPSGKTHLRYEAYVSANSISTLKDKNFEKLSTDWFSMNAAYTYVLLKPGSTEKQLQSELKAVAADLNHINSQGVTFFSTQSLADITPDSWSKFYFEMAVALIILLAACFNYTNLTTARALTRAKEVGIRKISGATRAQVVLQYVMESTVLSFLALGFAWVLMGLIIQYAPFNDGYEFVPSSFRYNAPIILCSMGYAFLTGLLAGIAPAMILSSFSPVRVLKNLSTARIFGKISLQKSLIVFQYSLSLVIIIFLFGFYTQFSFMAGVDPGYKQKDVLVINLNGIDKKLAAQMVEQQPGVLASSGFSASLARGEVSYMQSWINSPGNAITLVNYYADENFTNQMGLKLIAGTPLLPIPEGGIEKRMLINQSASIALGFKNPEAAVGQMVHCADSSWLQIAGVLQNFYYQNAGIPIRPMTFRYNNKMLSYLYVNTKGANHKDLEAKINAGFKKLDPTSAVSSSWLQDDLANGNSQSATISLLGYIAFMAIAIATLGLTGLVIYTVEIKRKQISIRKVLGAGRKQILQLLSGGFIKLLLIAGLIGIPIGYTGVILFLQVFAQRTSFSLFNPLACYAFLLVIGLVTVLSQTWKAVIKAPVDDLRSE